MIHRHSLLVQCMFIVCKGYHDKMISHTGKYPVMLCKQPNTCTVYLYSSIHNIGIIFISHTCITWKTVYYHMQLTYLLITCTNLNYLQHLALLWHKKVVHIWLIMEFRNVNTFSNVFWKYNLSTMKSRNLEMYQYNG